MILSIRDKLLTWSDELEQRAKSLQQIADAHAGAGRAICAGLVNAQVRKLLKESQAKRKRAACGFIAGDRAARSAFGVTL